MNKNFFEFLYIIGRGGFGKVWKVKLKKTNEYFALKEMSKLKIIDRRSEISIMSEKTLLSKLNNPFIVNMYFTFQDFSNLYLVMDLLTGGDLRYHIAKRRRFTEKETKFFIANMLLALEYIHSKNIIHRDIKPENLVLELNGYLRITDFGVAKINEKDNSSETSGTPGYMAPEVILVQNHSFPSDFFALGVIGFEFMLGYRPYLGGSRKEIKELIIYKQAKLEEDDIPYSWSLEAGDFINKLLKRKPSQRLGYHGVKEIKNHFWMRDINWNLLKKKEITAPFIPNPNRENFDKAYCEKVEDIGETTIERYQEYVESELFLEVFEGYTYINLDYLNSKMHRNKKNNEENNENKKEKINENKENKEEKIKVSIVNENNKEENKENENKNNESTKRNKEKEKNEEVIDNNEEILEVKSKEENENNDDKKTIVVDSSRIKKNYSINLNKNKRKKKSVSQGKILNNSSHSKLKINLYKKNPNINKNTNIKPINYSYKKQINDNENKKEALKRMSPNDNIKVNKNYTSNMGDMVNDKVENDTKLKYDKEMLRKRALKISSKMKEMKKKNDSNTNSNLNNKKNNSKRLAMNKSSSMKMLNSMKKDYLNKNYVNNFIKNSSKRKESKNSKGTKEFVTQSKNRNNNNNELYVEKKKSYQGLVSPNQINLNSKEKQIHKFTIDNSQKNKNIQIKGNNTLKNDKKQNIKIKDNNMKKIKEEKKIKENNINKISDKTKIEENIINEPINKNKENTDDDRAKESKDNNIIQENENDAINKESNINNDNKNEINEITTKIDDNNKIVDDRENLNIIKKETELEDDNPVQTRSKIMLWIHKSMPFYSSVNQTKKFSTVDNNLINNSYKKSINNSIEENNNSENIKINEIKKNININENDKIDLNNISNIKRQNKLTSDSYNNKKAIKTVSVDNNNKKSKNIIKQKHYKSLNNTKRRFPKNNSSSSIYFNKQNLINKTIKSKSPKNTFLVFNTININLGQSNNQKRNRSPKIQVMKNVNYLNNELFLEPVKLDNYMNKRFDKKNNISTPKKKINQVKNKKFKEFKKNDLSNNKKINFEN